MILMSLLFVATTANAAPVDGEMPADRDNCRNRAVQSSTLSKDERDKLMDLCVQAMVYNRDAGSTISKIRTLQNQKKDCFGWSLTSGRVSTNDAELAACKADQAKLATDISDLEGKLKTAQGSLRTAQANFNAANSGARNSATDRQAMINGAENEFNNLKLSFFSAELQAANANVLLANMARSLDNSAMGLYLRERMAGVLNSDAMCQTVKKCPAGIKGSDLNSVFNSSMKTSVKDGAAVSSGAAGGGAKGVGTNQ